jgi:hypothetical protein
MHHYYMHHRPIITLCTIHLLYAPSFYQVDDDTGYLAYLGEFMIENLNRRMNSAEAQTVEEVARVS